MTDEIAIKIPKEFMDQLKQQGSPHSLMMQKEFTLESSVATFLYQQDRMKPINMKARTQIEHFSEVMDDPLGKPYVYIISGRPNDSKAKNVAATLMIQAAIAKTDIMKNPKHPLRRIGKMGYPRWIRLTNSWSNEASNYEKPCMFVLSNITPNITTVKLEKIREILELHDDVPRVLVLNEFDPIAFANERIFYPYTYVMNLLNTSVKRTTEI